MVIKESQQWSKKIIISILCHENWALENKINYKAEKKGNREKDGKEIAKDEQIGKYILIRGLRIKTTRNKRLRKIEKLKLKL